jgi:hypothetical protein
MKSNFYPFKRLVLLLLLAVFTFQSSTVNAQSCSATSPLFGLDGSGVIYPVSTTGTVGSALNTSSSYTSNIPWNYTTKTAGQNNSTSSPNAIGYDNITGIFYYFKRDPASSSSSGQFIAYNPLGSPIYNTLTSPNPTITTVVHAGCFRPAPVPAVVGDRGGYYCLDVAGQLYYYNIFAHTWTLISANFRDQFNNDADAIFADMNAGDMAIDGLGNLWILPTGTFGSGTTSNYALYKLSAPPITAIPAATAVIVEQIVPPTTVAPSGSGAFHGMAFDALGNMYLSAASNNDIYKLTSPTATPIKVGTASKNFTDLTSCVYPLTVLPIRWNDFTATLQNKGTVLLNWSITEGPSNKILNIQRSADGINWKVISSVPNHQTNNYAYSFTDFTPVTTSNYYRIQQVDYDGRVSYSDTRMITIKNAGQISFGQNPVIDILNIQLAANTTAGNDAYAMGFDVAGRVLFKAMLQPGNTKINVKGIPTGTYMVQVHLHNGDMVNKKIVIQ